jgi:hypothetical protein
MLVNEALGSPGVAHSLRRIRRPLKLGTMQLPLSHHHELSNLVVARSGGAKCSELRCLINAIEREQRRVVRSWAVRGLVDEVFIY